MEATAMTLIPWQVQAGAAVIAAGTLFAGGWKVEGWRDAGELDTEKLAHSKDVGDLKQQWSDKLDAEHKLLTQAQADLEAERKLNEIAKENAERDYQVDLAKRQAAADRAAADTQRVRDELAAAIAAGRPASGSDPVRQAGQGASCSGSGGGAVCGLLGRAIDLATRCADAAGKQHAALVEAIGEWPQ
jgi:hypothetical protein